MSTDDRTHWDRRWEERGMASPDYRGPPPEFGSVEQLVPTSGRALEVACGRGRGAVWLASRGLDYFGVDISPVAIDLARNLTAMTGLSDLCDFRVHDLESGLPEGPKVDVLLCYKYRQRDLDGAMIDRLRPGGLLLIAALSEVGARPGTYRVPAGELVEAFASLDVKAHDEGDGMAWLVGVKS